MMKILQILTVITVLFLISTDGFAVSLPAEEHFVAQIWTTDPHNPKSAHGYVRLITDGSGKGLINVMFSNELQSRSARFYTRIRFFNQQGQLIGEKLFNCQVHKADSSEAFERKLTEKIEIGQFESVSVDFYTAPVKSSDKVWSPAQHIIKAEKI